MNCVDWENDGLNTVHPIPSSNWQSTGKLYYIFNSWNFEAQRGHFSSRQWLDNTSHMILSILYASYYQNDIIWLLRQFLSGWYISWIYLYLAELYKIHSDSPHYQHILGRKRENRCFSLMLLLALPILDLLQGSTVPWIRLVYIIFFWFLNP